MKLKINSQVCAGHGRCYTLAPEVFESDDDGFAEPKDKSFDVPANLIETARRGANSCPERAVEIFED